ncbi:MAG: FtsQ-type POTRA domain-containing protein [Chloroflexi bacterium]|uniref:cell division protein FtsQ/DivIB n=1 Tax=Candidatus Flexifilum breve TaxID=3140694 RepID=UPI00313667EF|nr:FtsQ-type POTRA domain-containing protein [Chloroflexota bacterium]
MSRRSTREPAIWRNPDIGSVDRPQALKRGQVFVSWRLFSGALILILLGALAFFFFADSMYVTGIAVGGLETMTVNEVYELLPISGLHVFWLDPGDIRDNLLESPTIANATVTVGFPPNMVQVIIEEREPALVWEQAGEAAWIDLQGRVMRQREDRQTLLRIQADPVLEGSIGSSVDPQVVTSAIQLHDLLPELAAFRYHPDKGLGYTDPRGWEVWLGVGADMQQKILIYNAIVADNAAQGIQPREINLVNTHRPFVSMGR